MKRNAARLVPAIALLATGLATWVFVIYWRRIGRDLLTTRELLLLPRYLVAKLSIHGQVLTRRQIEWIRSKRD